MASSQPRRCRLRHWAVVLALMAAPVSIALGQSQPAAGARPRIGLVLSGGGARGVAHVGVLKVLEQAHVPIDAIAGTSMGAVVGGLYASGMSAAEIEAMMTTVDWQNAFRDRPPRQALVFRRKREDQNFLVRFPLGISSGEFKLPKGLIQGQKLSQMLRRLTLPVAAVSEFDRLPTPFRAVATDLETGTMRVLDRGDITDAMRASVAAPGLFNPVELSGRLLVDGGLSVNLPVDVARSMGVDILIVVDVGFPLLERGELNSVARISNQMLAILIQRESAQQRASLTPQDLLITPALGSTSSFDFTNLRQAIAIGVAGALGLAWWQGTLTWENFIESLMGATRTSAMIALILAATPIFAALIGLAFGTEVLPRRFWVGAALSFAGVGFVALGAGGEIGGDLGGILLGILTAATWAVYSILITPLMQRYSPSRISAVVLSISWVGIAVTGWSQTSSQDWQLGWEVWMLFLFATIGPLVVTNVLWFTSLDRIGPSRATLATNLQPFVAALFAVVLLGERINALQVAGGLLIGAGILAARRRSPVSPGE